MTAPPTSNRLAKLGYVGTIRIYIERAGNHISRDAIQVSMNRAFSPLLKKVGFVTIFLSMSTSVFSSTMVISEV